MSWLTCSCLFVLKVSLRALKGRAAPPLLTMLGGLWACSMAGLRHS